MKDPLNTRPQGAPPGDGLIARSYRLCLTLLVLCFIFMGFSGTQAFAQCPTITINTETAYVSGMAGASTTSNLYKLNLATGALTNIGSIGVGLTVSDITVSTDGKTIFGLTTPAPTTGAQFVIGFSPANPATITSSFNVTGLAAGEILVGFDRRPATGQLFALGVLGGSGPIGSIYTIDPTSGIASRVAPITGVTGGSLLGTFYGFDFNPTSDRIRVVNDANQNLKLNPLTGANATPADPNITPITADVVAAAYTNNFPGATTTVLYDIDFTANRLVTQSTTGATNGMVTTVAPLTLSGAPFDITGTTGFDIYSAVPTVATIGFPYSATLPVSGGTGPYTFTATGKLPTGLLFNSSTGTISGTPSKLETFTVTIVARDVNGCLSAPVNITITTVCPPTSVSSNAGYVAFIPLGGTNPHLYGIELTAGFDPSAATLHDLGQIAPLGPGVNARGLALQAGTDTFFTTNANKIASFNRNAPGVLTAGPININPIVGNLMGIDFRPATGVLYALTKQGTNLNLYTVGTGATGGPALGLATLVGQLVDSTGAMIVSNGSSYGFDFNPTVDRIRVVDDFGDNYRVNPNTAVTTVDPFLTFNPNDILADPNFNFFGIGPIITGAAYTNNFAGSTSTTLYDLDGFFDALTTQKAPIDGSSTLLSEINTVDFLNFGTLPDVSGFGGTITDGGFNGFDIDSGVTGTSALPVGSLGSFYSASVQTNGGAPGATFTYAISSGALPNGLVLDPNTGAVTGQPLASGVFNFTISSSNKGNIAACPVNKAFSVNIQPALAACSALAFTPTALAKQKANTSFTFTVGTTGGVNDTFGSETFFLVSGSFPATVKAVQTAANVLTFSGTAPAGNYTFTLRAIDVFGCTAVQTYTLSVSTR